MQKSRSVLVADPDKAFMETLKADPITSQFPLLFVSTGTEAQLVLSDPSERFMGIFISPKLENPSWISVLKCAHLNRPGTPLYMILPNETSWKLLTDIEMKHLGLKDAIQRPTSYADLIKLVNPLLRDYDVDGTVRKGRRGEKIEAEILEADSEFISIRAEDFMSGSQSCFDVYVLIRPGKFIKLLKAGDSFEVERLENYLRKA